MGQPQGSRRPQPFPGRLPRPRQYRRLRPFRSAARRRHTRAGRRHRLDGALLPVDAADRVELATTTPLRRHGRSIRRPLRRIAVAPSRPSATRRCGTRRTASTTTHALSDGKTPRSRFARWSGLLPMCAATVFDPEVFERHPISSTGRRDSSTSSPTPSGAGATAWTRSGGPAHRVARRRALDCGGCWRRCSTRTSSSDRMGSVRSRAATSTIRRVRLGGRSTSSDYLPAESDTGMFGGNSNWRGPVWFPMNSSSCARCCISPLLRRAPKVECPTGSGQEMNLLEVAYEIRGRLRTTFTARREGTPAIVRRHRELPDRPDWRDLVPFHEYFHGDNGAGLGASHQTGWTGTVASCSCSAHEPSAAHRGRRPTLPAERRRASPCDCHRRPTIYEINTAVWLSGWPWARPAADALRGPGRRVGRDRVAAGRRGLADGRVGAQPGRPRDRAQTRSSARQPRRAAGSERPRT